MKEIVVDIIEFQANMEKKIAPHLNMDILQFGNYDATPPSNGLYSIELIQVKTHFRKLSSAASLKKQSLAWP